MRKILPLVLMLVIFSCSKKEKTTKSSSIQVHPLTKIELPKDPSLPPNFYWKTPDGEKNFYEFSKGKTILVNFWATWCGPCVKEIPDLISLASELRDKNFEIIGISIDRSISPVIEFAKNVGINYTLIHDGESQLLKAFGGSIGIPTTYLIDRNGKIVAKIVGARDKDFFKNEVLAILK